MVLSSLNHIVSVPPILLMATVPCMAQGTRTKIWSYLPRLARLVLVEAGDRLELSSFGLCPPAKDVRYQILAEPPLKGVVVRLE